MTAITTAPDEETAAADERPWRARAAEFVLGQGFIVIFLAWAVFLSVRTEQFLTTDNLLLLVRQASIFSIVGIGTTMVVLLGELDISFGSIVSLAGCVSAAWIVGGTNPLVGFVIAIVIGVIVGVVNGVLVTRFRIASVVATLGTLGIAAGLASIYTSGSSIHGARLDSISDFYLRDIVGIPVIALLAIGLYIVFTVIVTRTPFGAHLYATGDSEAAAYRAGVRTSLVKFSVFVIAGGLAGFAGLLQVARIGRAQATMGADFLFPVLTAVILGGISMHGGKGRLFNTLIASVFLVSITNGLILLGVDSQVQTVVQGAVLIFAVSLDRLRD